MTIGEKIKLLRKEHDMTQEALGAAVGLKKAAINKYELGTVVNLKRTVIDNIAKVFNVNSVWLMDDSADFPPVPRVNPPKTIEAQIISGGVDKLPKEQREMAVKVMQTIFAQYSDYFNEKGNDENDS